MTLSIIVAVYNGEKFLHRCLDSLLRQGLNTGEYEVICVNDGSPDNSAAILAEYERTYPDIFRIVTQENHGLGLTRNTGMNNAKGEYITFVDQDDFVFEGGFHYLCTHFLESKPDVLTYSCEIIQNCSVDKEHEHYEEGKITFDGKGREAFNRLYDMINVWSKFYRRSFLEDNNILFENITPEDTLFNLEVFRRNPRVLMTDSRIYGYVRDNQDSITLSRSKEGMSKLLEGRVYVIGRLNRCCSEENQDMMQQLKFCICWMTGRFYSWLFFMHCSKQEWKRYAIPIRNTNANKFLYERERTIKRKLSILLKCSASYSYFMYKIVWFFRRISWKIDCVNGKRIFNNFKIKTKI